jgi:hypothetical protein
MQMTFLPRGKTHDKAGQAHDGFCKIKQLVPQEFQSLAVWMGDDVRYDHGRMHDADRMRGNGRTT